MFTGQPAFDGEREDRLLVCYCPREIFVKGWMPLGHAIRVHSFIFCQIIFAIIIIILVVSQNHLLVSALCSVMMFRQKNNHGSAP